MHNESRIEPVQVRPHWMRSSTSDDVGSSQLVSDNDVGRWTLFWKGAVRNPSLAIVTCWKVDQDRRDRRLDCEISARTVRRAVGAESRGRAIRTCHQF